MSKSQQAFAIQFFNASKVLIEELRALVYTDHAQRLLKLDQLSYSVQSVNWNLRDFKNEVNPYMERVAHQVSDGMEKLKALGGGSIPASVQNVFMEHAAAFVSEELVEAYSKLHKCSQAGRELMRIDLNYLRGKVEFTLKKNLHCFDEVESYVNAYLSDSSGILAWAAKSPRFTVKQVKSIAKNALCTAQMKRNEKKDFVAKVDKYFVEFLLKVDNC